MRHQHHEFLRKGIPDSLLAVRWRTPCPCSGRVGPEGGTSTGRSTSRWRSRGASVGPPTRLRPWTVGFWAEPGGLSWTAGMFRCPSCPSRRWKAWHSLLLLLLKHLAPGKLSAETINLPKSDREPTLPVLYGPSMNWQPVYCSSKPHGMPTPQCHAGSTKGGKTTSYSKAAGNGYPLDADVGYELSCPH